MSRITMAADAAIAVALAGLVLIVSPGVAIAGLAAIVALIVCGVSFLLDRRSGRARALSRARRDAARGRSRARPR